MIPAFNYSIPSTVMLQKIDDETLLFDSETEKFFTLNEVGTVMWEVISKNSSIIGVYEELKEIFDIEEEQLEYDFSIFTKALYEQGLFQILPPPSNNS
jgi:hypothetical protein